MRFTLLILTAVAAVVFVAFPGIDLWFSTLFWDGSRGFFLKEAWWAEATYELIPKLVPVITAAALLTLAHNLIRKRPLGQFTNRRVLYLVLALALGPGLVVNVVFKDHWGRARPRDVAEFGGNDRFTPAFVISDECDRNCSFVAGHPSVLFWLASVAFVVRRRRRLWFATAAGLGALAGLARIVQGAHFLSDVVFSGLFVFAVCYLLARYVFRLEERLPYGTGRAPGGRSVAAGLGLLLGALSWPAGVGTGLAQEPESAAVSTVRLIAVGDIMMGTSFPSRDYLNPALVPGVDLGSMIGEDLLGLLHSGDIVFGNQEGALFDGDGETKSCRNPELCYTFRSPEFYAGLLADMGFSIVSLANNHSGDFRAAGRVATMDALRRVGIEFAGLDHAGARTAVLSLGDGTSAGIVAFSPNKGTLSINDLGRAQAIVRRLASEHDIVVVSFHGGAEGADHTGVPREPEVFYGERRGDVWAFAHAVVDAGADVVLGHGPHVPRAVEVYRRRFIAYSLGNFWTYGRFNLRGPNGLAPVVDLELARDGLLLAARVHSARQAGLGIPRMDTERRAFRLMAELTARDFPKAGLIFLDDGTIRGPWEEEAVEATESEEAPD
jgi:membrane-associated PAP2 superfamily phosphatase